MLKQWVDKKVNLLFLYFLSVNIVVAQTPSPFNGLKVKDSLRNYSFIVSGHFHGASTNYSTFPASTILAGIDTINTSRAAFLISLGDLFLDVNEQYIKNYKKSLFDKLKIPLFNAVGNHDISNNNQYTQLYGKSFFAFKTITEQFIFLDTEVKDGDIVGEQLGFLKKTVQSLDPSCRNVFILSHRPVWAQSIKKYEQLFKDNTRSILNSNNFNNEIVPLLKKVSGKEIFWISGSMGNGAASFFYDKNEEFKITFMQTAIRDLPRDAVLKVSVNNGTVSFQGISLTGQEVKKIETYNFPYWNKTIPDEQKVNYRLMPYLIFKMICHHYFWAGFAFALVMSGVALFLTKQKWKRKK